MYSPSPAMLWDGQDGANIALPDTFFLPSAMESPDIRLSSTGGAPCSTGGPGTSKRSRPDSEDATLERLEVEVKRLRGQNAMLWTSCDNIKARADAALEEHQRLLMLISALQPHKEALTLQPLESQRSSVDSSATTVLLSHIEAAATATPATVEQPRSPSKSQPVPQSQHAFSPGASSQRRVQSARPAEFTGLFESGASQSGPLGNKVASNEEREMAQAAAVAAAALAVNNGNPAAALLDLLNLAMRRSSQTEQPGIY